MISSKFTSTKSRKGPKDQNSKLKLHSKSPNNHQPNISLWKNSNKSKTSNCKTKKCPNNSTISPRKINASKSSYLTLKKAKLALKIIPNPSILKRTTKNKCSQSSIKDRGSRLK
jgi:hypothetical protein